MTVSDGYPTKKRVHLPVDFDGPICDKCEHVQRIGDWYCTALPQVVSEPAWLHPVTGVVSEVRYEFRPLCFDRNERGDCKDFQRKAQS